MIHAQLDVNQVCVGYSNLTNVESSENLVFLPGGWNEDFLWRKWNGTWSTEKYEGFPTATDPLVLAKKQKIAALKANESDALETFQSSALGSQRTYLSGLADMVLLNAEYSFVKGDDFDNQPIIWYTVETGNVPHTKAQFVQVYLDGRNHVAQTKYHRAALDAQVGAATTVEEVTAVVW